MPRPFPARLDWSHFDAQGDMFQRLCADLFRARNFGVRIMEPGGDGGRDIEVFLNKDVDLSANPTADWWVECKSRVQRGKSAVGEDVLKNVAYAMRRRISRLVLMTNHKFKNVVIDYFDDLNRDPESRIRGRVVEREELEDLIRATPQVFCDYFAPGTSPADWVDVAPVRDLDMSVNVTGQFDDEPITVSVTCRNKSFRRRSAVVRGSDGREFRITLEPFDQCNLKWPVTPGSDLNVDVGEDNGTTVNANTRVPLPKPRIDKIYVDPAAHRDQLCTALAHHEHVFITAGPGTGKSRLIREAAAHLGRASTIVDLSAGDYQYDFAQHLLFRCIDVDPRLAAASTPEQLRETIQRTGCDSHAASLLSGYLTGATDSIDTNAVIGLAVEMFTRRNAGKVVFVDNVHRFTLFDLRVLRDLLARRGSTIVCSARDEEISHAQVREFFDAAVADRALTVLQLTPGAVAENMRAFIEALAYDETTAVFLRKYARAGSFQELLVNLKELRMQKILLQDVDGRLRVTADVDPRPEVYRKAVERLVAALSERHGRRLVETVLGSAAIYGYYFPSGIADAAGDDAAEDVLDELISQEIVVIDQQVPYRSVNLRFDHELTHAIVVGAIPALARQRLERSVARYVEALDPADPAYSPQLLSHLFRRLNEVPRAVRYGNEHARRLRRKGNVADAHDTCKGALELLRQQYVDTTDEYYGLEIHTLISTIATGIEVEGALAMLPYMRDLELTLQLQPDRAATAQMHHFFARYHSDAYEADLAFARVKKALEMYREIGDERNVVAVLNLEGTLTKKFRAAPVRALRIHRDALLHARKLGDRHGVSDSAANLGAVLLESGKAAKALRWWRLAADSLHSTADYPALAYALIDYSYLLALCRPDSSDVEAKLLAALTLARRVHIKPQVARALINHANWAFFHHDKSDAAVAEATEALEIARGIRDPYLELLARFSLLMFSTRHAGIPEEYRDPATVAALLNAHVPDADPRTLGDNRLRNMLQYFAERHPDLVEGDPRLSVTGIDIYRRGDLFVTYY